MSHLRHYLILCPCQILIIQTFSDPNPCSFAHCYVFVVLLKHKDTRLLLQLRTLTRSSPKPSGAAERHREWLCLPQNDPFLSQSVPRHSVPLHYDHQWEHALKDVLDHYKWSAHSQELLLWACSWRRVQKGKRCPLEGEWWKAVEVCVLQLILSQGPIERPQALCLNSWTVMISSSTPPWT